MSRTLRNLGDLPHMRKYIYQVVSMGENRLGITGFSQKSDLVLAELPQTMLDLNRHINSHGKSADSDQQAHQQKLMRTFAFHCLKSDNPCRTTHVYKVPGNSLITLNMRTTCLSEKYNRTSMARTSLGSWKFV